MKNKLKIFFVAMCVSATSYAKDPNVQLAEALIGNLVPITEGFQHLQLGPVKLGPNGGNNIMGGGNLVVATNEGKISSKEIEALYHAACEKLESQYGDKVVTFRYKHPMGESVQSTRVQFDFGPRRQFYLQATIGESMDMEGKVNSVGFVFSRVQGLFEPSEQGKQDGWKLRDYIQKVE